MTNALPLPGTYAPRDNPGDYQGPAMSSGEDGMEPEPLTKLPEDVQNILAQLGKKVSARELYPRLFEIRQATEQRFFYRGDQFGFWNWDQNYYQVAQSGSGFVSEGAGSVQPTFRKPYNIYLGYAKSFMAVFCQSDAPTRFEPEDPKDSDDIRSAQMADKMARIIDKFASPQEAQVEVARLLWTDGRVVAHTRYVVDGQRFGFEDVPFVDEQAEGVQQPEMGAEPGMESGETGIMPEQSPQRVPKGREITDYYGVLETKIPMTARGFSEWDYLKLSTEHPRSAMKAAYPDMASKIGLGSQALTDVEEAARMARIGSSEGARQLSEDSIAYLCTRDQYWFRPSLYWELDEDDRARMIDLFPDGCHCVFVGASYCESRNETMDDHVDVLYAISDTAGGRISLGQPEVPIQKEFNDAMNYASEAIKYCIPATWYDPEMVDTDAIQDQQSEAGAHYPCKNSPPNGVAVASSFYTEPAAEFPAIFSSWVENLQGPLSQFLTGQQPALFGGEMEDQKTARGYAMARDQALGLMALVWVPFKRFRSSIMQKSVRIAAKERLASGQSTASAMVNVPGKPGQQEPIEVALEDLRGNVLCYPETNENFPESFTQRKNTIMQLFQFAGASPELTSILAEPDNLSLLVNLIGVNGFTIPQADDRDKQLQEIAEMRNSPPVPDMAAIAQEVQQSAMAGMGPPPLDPSTLPLTSSVPLGKFDNDAVELQVCVGWINSPAGQKAKRSQDPVDQQWYENVELHAGLHQQRIQQQQMQQAAAQMAMQAAAAAQHPAGGPPKPKAAPGKNAQGSPPAPSQQGPEGGLPAASGPAENPSPLM